MSDPFKDIRDKRMSELTPEQRDLAMELWLRQNSESFGRYYWYRDDALFPSLFRVIDRMRAERDELLQALKACLGMLEQASCSTGYCCCGSPVDRHGIGDGHSPVDEGDYYQVKAVEAARAAIAKSDAARGGEKQG